jgi:hypothetical protein
VDGPQHHGNDDHTDEEHQEEEPEIARLLDAGLDEPTRRRLGIPKGVKVTERMVSYLYNQLLDALDPSCYSKANDCMFDPAAIRADQGPDEDVELDTEDIADFVNMNRRVKAERLEAFIRSGLRGTHPDDAPHAGDYALGATYISSWENPKSSRRRTTWRDTSEKNGRKPLKPWLLRDLDALWWSKSGAGKGAPYRLKAISGGRADSGSLKLMRPASTMAKHAVRCANKPASLPGRLDRIEIGTALPVITSTPKPAVCEKSTVTANFADLPFWQPHVPFTAEHQWSINRRNQVESAYGRIKDEATQSVRRGTFRVFGRAKVTFAVLPVAMAAKLLQVPPEE